MARAPPSETRSTDTRSTGTASELVVYGLVDSAAAKALPPRPKQPAPTKARPYFRVADDATSLRTTTVVSAVLGPTDSDTPLWMEGYKPLPHDKIVPTTAQH